MFYRSFSLLVLGTVVSFPALPQAVISTHSGVVNFAEGSVLIDGEPFEQKPGKFSSLKEGSTLQTEAGRAEVLLTPDVILRIGANSAIRMVSNSFADTRVGFLSGSAIIESGESADTPVTILYQDYEVQSRENSLYRLDSDSPGITVLRGKAKVSLNAQSLVIGKDHQVPFTGTLHAQEAGDRLEDALDHWAQKRDQILAADSEAGSKTTDDLSVAEAWQDSSGLGDPYSGISPWSQGALASPFSISPGSPNGSLYATPVSPLDDYSTIYSYPTIEPGIPYALAFYPVAIILRPSRIIGMNPGLPVSIFGSRPVSGIPPIWRPRAPTSMPMPMRPVITRPPVVGATHAIVGGRR